LTFDSSQLEAVKAEQLWSGFPGAEVLATLRQSVRSDVNVQERRHRLAPWLARLVSTSLLSFTLGCSDTPHFRPCEDAG